MVFSILAMLSVGFEARADVQIILAPARLNVGFVPGDDADRASLQVVS